MARRSCLRRSEEFGRRDGGEARLGALRDRPADDRRSRNKIPVQQRRDGIAGAYFQESDRRKRRSIRGRKSIQAAGHSIFLEAFADGIARHGRLQFLSFVLLHPIPDRNMTYLTICNKDNAFAVFLNDKPKEYNYNP